VLPNNAGVDSPAAETGEYSEDEFDRIWSVNGRGYAIPLMLKHGGGSIINTASVASTVVFSGKIAYSAGMAAVTMLTGPRRSSTPLAESGINAICPGFTKVGHTHLQPKQRVDDLLAATPAGRMADASEMTVHALYLASDESRFVTGSHS
jgi:NAD(P)-dependent dehydrogenase (short-subunit alcohol dehydrogenase family)